ncbi:LOW QUALITY PROTEIN: hypothetical protein SPRG_15229 [Saprolegnia parasitica CBS 223.65]|uniref:Uncharacterized protein n=1 Tax=Saprolegnia parasitica (strain CBS 223.65) TaxID=695850 RepID=A0A067BR72_SAPPC|nr:LOW QUALITY PROTEIN: hypothetical protein SPRG_15229 [Saprolegnia parasitica CBS 223.65]KDO19290.1 LOW QUALITY PROTEIN: hypothetical protein SPRG_15229 [Saprolegnia parasitica CBS 223.65]|eukprot:XP_012210001.1 LOW QUALITY PROTEIN: hypothetical protein SPRG_15229 [Saprolegnia parasitica CBS 223.65]
MNTFHPYRQYMSNAPLPKSTARSTKKDINNDDSDDSVRGVNLSGSSISNCGSIQSGVSTSSS